MNRTPRILFVCYADSPHAQSWIDLLKGSEFEVRVFSLPLHMRLSFPPPWQFPTYVTTHPDLQVRVTNRVISLLPHIPKLKTLARWAEDRYEMPARWLKWIIRTWKPDILHSFPLNTAGKLTRKALEDIPQSRWPRWVISTWGSDIYLGINDPDAQENIDFILKHCDRFLADCRRDRRLALQAGLLPSKLALHDAVPGTGGLSLDEFGSTRSRHNKRNLIVIPKAFEREHANRTLSVLEALRLVEDALDGYEIHLVMCSKSVRAYLRRMPETLQRRCHCHGMLPQKELFEMLGRARVMVAPSLSDGTPNVMLEAMAAGALPLMSPMDSVEEWIEDGRNGLLAHALYPDQIAAALRRALTDDKLFESAYGLNWEVVAKRADRSTIRPLVLPMYRSLL